MKVLIYIFFIRNFLLSHLFSTYVAFADSKREIGVAAKNQHEANVQNTIYGMKHLLGHNVQIGKDYAFQTGKHERNGSVSCNVLYMNDNKCLHIDQITASFLAKLKADAIAAFKSASTQISNSINNMAVPSVAGCVIAVPSYFTKTQKNALLIAAGVAQLNCVKLFRETTALAINYGFYKKITNPHNVIFVDFGHSSIQVSVCSFSDDGIDFLAEKFDITGGRDIDKRLADYFKPKISGVDMKIPANMLTLLNEVEKLKEKLSVNETSLPLNLNDILMDDDAPLLSMDRSHMEHICEDIFEKIKMLMKECFDESRLNISDIHSIETVGGSSRIPKISKIIEELFGKSPVSTMNQDEAISRGSLLYTRLMKKNKNYLVSEKSIENIDGEKTSDFDKEHNSKEYFKIGQV